MVIKSATGDITGTPVPDVVGTGPEMSTGVGGVVSKAKLCVVTVAVGAWTTAAVKVNPLTVIGTGKLPLPQVGFVHVTLVLVKVGFQFRLLVARPPVKLVVVGAPAAVTPVSPVSVIVVGLEGRLQLSSAANVRLYVHVGGPADASVNVTA